MATRFLKKAANMSLTEAFPWTTAPLIVGAPMRVLSGPKLATAVSSAGGLGFIGPNPSAEKTLSDLAEARASLRRSSSADDLPRLPVGVGFQCWEADLQAAVRAVEKHHPCAVWLFAPRGGQRELDEWTEAVRGAYPAVSVWIQVGTLKESVEAAGSKSPPDVLVIQGAEAGGHGRAHDGMGLMTLLPEVADALRDSGIPLVAAGGISDGRGVAAALTLGATGAAMGTRFLASTEARIAKGYQDEVVRATDGGSCTARTTLYNRLRGTVGWPDEFSPRGVLNKSWEEYQAGVPEDVLRERYKEAEAEGDAGWGPEGRLATYAGAGVGLVRSVEDAESIVRRAREEARGIVGRLADTGV